MRHRTQTFQLRQLGWALLMRHKVSYGHLAGLLMRQASKKHLSILSKATSRMSQCICLSRKLTHLRLDRALLMRQNDANLRLTKNCGTGFQKAAQNPDQSNQADVAVYLFIENKMDTFKARQG